MTRFIVGRLLLVVPVLIGVSIIVFLLVQLAPGDVTSTLLGPMGSESAKEVLRVKMGLDKPLPIQYAKWLGQILQGDLGTSWVHKRPVTDIVLPKFATTALLAGTAALLAYLIGFLSGIFAAAKAYRAHDRVAMAFILILGSTPLYWLGLILVLLFSLTWRLLPATGMASFIGGGGVLDVLEHLILPAVTASLPSAAIIARMTRATMIETLSQNYIRVARAKGIRRGVILRKHALRNALPPIVTVSGMELGYLLGGVVFVEVVFAWPGLGFQLYNSIIGRDIPIVQGAVILIALAFVLINLFADVLNAYLDPRTRTAEGARES
ncbi:MAG: ABC transporter permease [Proteobacteria bacterium]|nr:ABC transporter permease [Pseudomonadota bacterium]